MKWKKFRLKTLASAEDIVAEALSEAGIEGVEIEDHVPLSENELKQMFVDIPLPAGQDDGTAYLDFYLDEDEDAPGILASVRERLENLRQYTQIGACTIEEGETEDVDWINNWKKYFHKFKVDDILIIPSWEKVEDCDSSGMVLHIDPGTAFGTGMHETTQLCMRQLKKVVTPQTQLLDVGTGSGILSIVALKLGARHAVGTDLDPCAVDAVKENLSANDVPESSMDMVLGNLIDDPKTQTLVGYDKYDVVTANILADVLIALAPHIVPAMKPEGILIMSGILDEREKDVEQAARKAGLQIVEVTHQNEWACVTAKKD
ncbi:50S ribosomal protein L11 methyltransferase [Porcincola sp. LCP21S3_C12]|uniref:50S ribosomal protein L11 methyltransferase n=1 Tax=Porcincola sp. LCP21S3_C12 TaxID=3438798 RepID=UPI003F96230D